MSPFLVFQCKCLVSSKVNFGMKCKLLIFFFLLKACQPNKLGEFYWQHFLELSKPPARKKKRVPSRVTKLNGTRPGGWRAEHPFLIPDKTGWLWGLWEGTHVPPQPPLGRGSPPSQRRSRGTTRLKEDKKKMDLQAKWNPSPACYWGCLLCLFNKKKSCEMLWRK